MRTEPILQSRPELNQTPDPDNELFPDKYSSIRLAEINFVRATRKLRPLTDGMTTPQTFRRIYSARAGMVSSPADVKTQMPQPDRVESALRELKEYREMSRLEKSLSVHDDRNTNGAIVSYRLLRSGLSLTIDISKPFSKTDLNWMTELYDTTQRLYFFALLTVGVNIVGHETCLLGLSKAMNQAKAARQAGIAGMPGAILRSKGADSVHEEDVV